MWPMSPFSAEPIMMYAATWKHEPYYQSVAVHRPEWGEWSEDWNLEFLSVTVNGYNLRITYNTDENKYHISADKEKLSACFDYSPSAKDCSGEFPDQDTVKQVFNDAFGTQGEDFYGKPLAYFEQFIADWFGMKITELYALPIK